MELGEGENGFGEVEEGEMVKIGILSVKVPDIMAPVVKLMALAMSSDLVGPHLVIATWSSIFLSSFL